MCKADFYIIYIKFVCSLNLIFIPFRDAIVTLIIKFYFFNWKKHQNFQGINSVIIYFLGFAIIIYRISV